MRETDSFAIAAAWRDNGREPGSSLAAALSTLPDLGNWVAGTSQDGLGLIGLAANGLWRVTQVDDTFQVRCPGSADRVTVAWADTYQPFQRGPFGEVSSVRRVWSFAIDGSSPLLVPIDAQVRIAGGNVEDVRFDWNPRELVAQRCTSFAEAVRAWSEARGSLIDEG